MNCDEIREALSAQMDSETYPPGVDGAWVEVHLGRCEACRRWLAEVTEVGRRLRIRVATPTSAVPDAVVAGLRPPAISTAGWKHQVALRVGLVVAAFVEVAVVVPPLLFGHDREAPVHVAHEMGSFSLAVAIGLLAAAQRPRRAAGMLSVIAVAGAALLVTAAIDVAQGATSLWDEAPHLIVVVGAWLLWALSRTCEPRRTFDEVASAVPNPVINVGPTDPTGARLRLVRRAGIDGRRRRSVA